MATKAASKPTTASSANAASMPRPPRTLAGHNPSADPERKTTLGLYEKALKLIGAGKYPEAHEAFQQMLHTAPPEFSASIRTYIAVCVSQMTKRRDELGTNEERFDYGISLLNHGNYEDAREVFHELLSENPECDYAFYGLALLSSMTSESEECLKHLSEAIRLNPQNRLQARADSDFANVADDPLFTELLYPEA